MGNYFEELSAINVNDKIEQKNKLSYLSWTYAFGELKKRFPDVTYEVMKFANDLPYVYDENTGYMVFTKVTLNGITNEMWLPVMDGANKAMKNHSYTYQVKDWKSQRMVEKTVEPATMFDINKTIMRCLVKNIAVASGLGLYIYAGEDLPEDLSLSETVTDAPQKTQTKPVNKTTPKAKEKPQTPPQAQIQTPVEEIEKCMQCARPIEAGGGMTSAQVAKARKDKYGMPLCQRCANIIKAKQAEKAKHEQVDEPLVVEPEDVLPFMIE